MSTAPIKRNPNQPSVTLGLFSLPSATANLYTIYTLSAKLTFTWTNPNLQQDIKNLQDMKKFSDLKPDPI